MSNSVFYTPAVVSYYTAIPVNFSKAAIRTNAVEDIFRARKETFKDKATGNSMVAEFDDDSHKLCVYDKEKDDKDCVLDLSKIYEDIENGEYNDRKKLGDDILKAIDEVDSKYSIAHVHNLNPARLGNTPEEKAVKKILLEIKKATGKFRGGVVGTARRSAHISTPIGAAGLGVGGLMLAYRAIKKRLHKRNMEEAKRESMDPSVPATRNKYDFD